MVVGPERGAIMGAIIGFSFDLVLQTPLGLSALVYGLAALAVGTVSTGTIKSHPVDPRRGHDGGQRGGRVRSTPLLAAVFGVGATPSTCASCR